MSIFDFPSITTMTLFLAFVIDVMLVASLVCIFIKSRKQKNETKKEEPKEIVEEETEEQETIEETEEEIKEDNNEDN